MGGPPKKEDALSPRLLEQTVHAPDRDPQNGLSSAKPDAAPITLPMQLGKYLLVKRLGGGGSADVYLGKLEGTNGITKSLAIKCLHPSYANDPEFVFLFEFEAKLTSRLSHPNIVSFFDFGQAEGRYFIAMEYAEGKDLGQFLSLLELFKQPLPLAAACYIMSEICSALHYVHSLRNEETGESYGIVHRDVTARNVMICFNGAVQLFDFGISRARDRARITDPTAIRGTRRYLAPEVKMGAEATQSSDIYSAGVIFYELLSAVKGPATAVAPERNPETLIKGFAPLPSDIPKELRAVLRKALAPMPSDRYQSAMLLHRDINQLVNLSARIELQNALAQTLREMIKGEPEEAPVEKANPTTATEASHTASSPAPSPAPMAEKPQLNADLFKRERATPYRGTRSRVVPRSSHGVLVALGALSLVMIVGLFLFFTIRRPAVLRSREIAAYAPAAHTQGCLISIDSSPSGADIFINGEPIAKKTPSQIPFQCGEDAVIGMKKSGFKSVARTVRPSEKSFSLHLDLSPGADTDAEENDNEMALLRQWVSHSFHNSLQALEQSIFGIKSFFEKL